MNKEIKLSRITIDIPQESHKRLKTLAALQGRSMRDIVIESIELHLHSAIPNKETLKAIRNTEMGKDLIETNNVEDLFKKLGI